MAATKKKLPKAPKGSKRLDKNARVHVKGERIAARLAEDGTHRFSRRNDEGTVSEWKIVPRSE